MKKIFFTFDFHILPEHRRIGGKCMRAVLTHLLRIKTVSKLSDCGRKSQNYVHIDTY